MANVSKWMKQGPRLKKSAKGKVRDIKKAAKEMSEAARKRGRTSKFRPE